MLALSEILVYRCLPKHLHLRLVLLQACWGSAAAELVMGDVESYQQHWSIEPVPWVEDQYYIHARGRSEGCGALLGVPNCSNRTGLASCYSLDDGEDFISSRFNDHAVVSAASLSPERHKLACILFSKLESLP